MPMRSACAPAMAHSLSPQPPGTPPNQTSRPGARAHFFARSGFGAGALSLAALLAVTAWPASAIEPAAVADALGAALTRGANAEASYEAVALDGENVVVDGLTLTGTKSEQAIRFEQAVVESPAEDGTGLFKSPRITLSAGAATGGERGSVGSVTATDVTVLDPEAVESESFTEAFLYGGVEIKDVKVVRDSVPSELSVGRVSVSLSDANGDAPQDMTGRVEGFSVTGDIFTHRRFSILARARLRLEELGYDALVFDADWRGTWDRAAGTVTISESSLDFRDNARFVASGTVGNLPDPRVFNDADMVAQVAKLRFHDFVARYEEVAFAGRVFDLLAREQELSRSEYIEQLSLALPFLLASLTHPTFREDLIAMLRAFFKDPRSLTLSIDPEAPISGTEIIDIAKSELGDLPDRLKASVSANGQN